MSGRLAPFSYIHMDDAHKVLCIEQWQDSQVPYNDIETNSLVEATASLFPRFLLEEEEDGALPGNSTAFGNKVYKNHKLLKENTWSDLGIHEKFLDETSNLHKEKDKTILKAVYTKPTEGNKDRPGNDMILAEFLSNGHYNSENLEDASASSEMINDSVMGNNNVDIFVNSSNDHSVPNNTFSINMRSASGSNSHGVSVQTPRVERSRQYSTDRVFHTPVTRSMR